MNGCPLLQKSKEVKIAASGGGDGSGGEAKKGACRLRPAITEGRGEIPVCSRLRKKKEGWLRHPVEGKRGLEQGERKGEGPFPYRQWAWEKIEGKVQKG